MQMNTDIFEILAEILAPVYGADLAGRTPAELLAMYDDMMRG